MVPVDLTGTNALVLGVASKRSLAWGIAERLAAAGARLALTYQGERLRDKVESLAEGLDEPLLVPLDVTDDDQLREAFARVGEVMPRLHALVHSVAFAPARELQGRFRDTSREGWRVALEISAYSFVSVAGHAAHLLAPREDDDQPRGGSMVTLSYLAAERAVPRYNVMGTAKAALEQAVRQLAFELGPSGVRVNAISAGPVSTLAARTVPGFSDMLRHHREKACLRRNVTQRDVADAALFLVSDLAAGITGETLHVDAGYSVVGW